MERIQISRTKSLRARNLRTAEIRAEADAPLAHHAPGGPVRDDDLMARIDAVLAEQHPSSGDAAER